jgi:hypothetical protein
MYSTLQVDLPALRLSPLSRKMSPGTHGNGVNGPWTQSERSEEEEIFLFLPGLDPDSSVFQIVA